MDVESWNAAEERRAKKFGEIMRLLAQTLGDDAKLEQETKDAIEQWEETVEMEVIPPDPKTPLQCLLRDYHDICEEILDIQDYSICEGGDEPE